MVSQYFLANIVFRRNGERKLTHYSMMGFARHDPRILGGPIFHAS